MRKYFVFILAIIAMLLGTACSNQLDDVDVVNNGVVELEEASAPIDDDFWGENLSYDEIDVDAYIGTHPETFGNVLVFESLDEVESLLEDMNLVNNSQELTEKYVDLQTTRSGFSNPIIESHILYLSIYEDIARQYGYDIDTEEDLEIESEDFYTTLDERLQEEVSNGLIQVVERTYTDPETGEISDGTYIEPLGELSIGALTNERSLVIIDNVVYYFFEDALITMPINKFHHLAEHSFTNLEALENALSDCSTLGLTEDDFVMSREQEYIPYTNFTRTQRYHENIHGRYKMTIRISASDVWVFTAQTARCGRFTIKNYKKNLCGHWILNGKKCKLNGSVSFKTYPHIEEPQPPFVVTFTNYKVGGIFTHHKHIIYNTHYFWPMYGVFPYDIHIDLSNNRGCHINY